MVTAITKLSIMVIVPVVLCLIIIIILSINFLSSFLPIWINDAIAVEEVNQKQFYDYFSYVWGLKVASQYHKIQLGHTLTMDFLKLLEANQALIANASYNPLLLNKIALSQGRIRRSISDLLNTQNGSYVYTTWYHKSFTETNQLDSYPDTKSNLLNYAINLDPIMKLFFSFEVPCLKNEAVNITFDNDGLLYSYPAIKDSNFETANNVDGCTYGSDQFSYDDRCSSYYQTTKDYTNNLYIDEPFRQAAGDNLRQIICNRDNTESIDVKAIICNQMNLYDLNLTYYESYSRLTNAYPGYFFIASTETLKALYHPSLLTNKTTLELISTLELNSSITSPNSTEFTALFDFSNLTTNSILVITPIDQTGNSATGLKPDTVDLLENVLYKEVSYLDTSGINVKLLLVKPIMINTLSSDKKTLNKEKLFYLGLIIDKVQAIESLDSFQDFMQEVIYLLIVFLIQIFLAIILYTLRFAGLVFRQMLQPVKDIVQDLEKLDPIETEKFDLLGNVDKRDSKEIYNMRGVFQKLIQVMKAAKGAYIAGNDTQALLNYAQAKVLYQELGNMKGVGICESNIGTIHLKSHHYGEAISAYTSAINISTNEINEFSEIAEKDVSESRQKSNSEFQQIGFQSLNREKLILANRMFNLAHAYVLESQHTKNRRWQSAIDNYQLVKKMDQSLNINPHRVILISIELAKVYLQIGNIQKAESSLKEAEESLLQRAFESLDIPRVILDNKIKMIKAAFAKENGNNFEAAELLTSVLEEGDLYDPADRKKCLEELHKILKVNNIECAEVESMLTKFQTQNFEFVFLVDASFSMSGLKIQNAVVTINKIFANYLGDDDKVGYIYFNDSPRTVFNLTYKSSNKVQLENYLKRIPETKGATSMLGSIYLALQEFKGSDLENLPLSKKKKEELQRNRWIIMITDGGDDFEENSEKSFVKLQQFMQKQKVNLLVVGYTKNESKMEYLQRLGNVTSQSQFIDVDHADDLSPFFKSLVEGPTEILPALESF